MKKQVKKLKLAKETVRSLTQADLGKAAGGTTYWTCWSDPEYSCQQEFNPLTGLSCSC